MSDRKKRTIRVDYLPRVEGEGALLVKIRDGQVNDVQLRIFEPPRFFEAFLRGRRFTEVPDITARICGICPVAYQTSSINAMENICGVKVPDQIRQLRKLLYLGEWIESHALHVYMLHAPDFLGYHDALQMAKDHPEAVKKALKIKKIGNEVMIVLGGREIHPINSRLGGFYRVPESSELNALLEKLEWAREACMDTIEFTSGLKMPDLERDYEFVALRHPTEYGIVDGRIVSNKGLDIDVSEFDNHFMEIHVERSTSLHSVIRERGSYKVGPLARYAINYDRLPDICKDAAKTAGLGEVCLNPFKSIIVRSVELLYACDEAIKVIKNYKKPEQNAVEVVPRAGIGYGASEAPRGLLVHKYKIDDKGIVLQSNITPPTAQNQRIIEEDLWNFIPNNLHLSDKDLTWVCEQAIRNYDPCISCSCHFLKLNIERN